MPYIIVYLDIVVPEARLECIKKILSYMPPVYLILLMHLILFLRLVSQHADVNKMTPSNLAMVFAPNLLKSRDQTANMSMLDTNSSSTILESMIQNFDFLFGVSVILNCDDCSHG
jgi:hypothetical protein